MSFFPMLGVALVVILTIVAAMAVGVLMGRKPLQGSCGGVGAALGEPNYECDICGGDESKCEASSESSAKQSSELFRELKP